MKLPVFKVAAMISPADHIRELGQRLFPQQDQEIIERGTTVALRTKDGNIEIDVGRGGIWASDDTRLWRFDPTLGKPPNLLAAAEAERVGLDLLKRHALLPDIDAWFRARSPRITGAKTAYIPKRDAPRQVVQQDITVLIDIEADVSRFGLPQKTLPLVGGGGRFSVVLGDGGRPLGTRGVWRPPVGEPKMYEVIPQQKADEAFRAMMANVPVVEVSSELAYYCAPAFSGQDYIYPVYVYSAVADYKGTRVPLRRVMVNATEVGEGAPAPIPTPERKRTDAPSIRALPSDFQLTAGKPLPPGIALNRRLLKARGKKLRDYFVPGPMGSALIVNPDLTAAKLKEVSSLLSYYSAGTSWIGLSGGLAGSQNNALGFVNELSAIGWNLRFNWGDAAAWESDWRANDDTWVDSADFVFYTGHANSDGWVLSAPDDTFLHFTETAGSRDLWGANNLEWAVVAACGPLQDEVVGSGGNVLSRWRDAFDGLHMLLGYAQITYDNTEEGKRLAKYAKAGSTIMQSWFRTGQEIQPGGIWVGAYYVGDASGSTGGDHLWGAGTVGPDITSPTWWACSWVPC